MPVRCTPLREQSHRQRRGIDHPYPMHLEETQIVGQQRIVQTVVTEAEHTLHHPLVAVFDDPLQVLGLEVGDTHMAHNALLLQSYEHRQRLIDNLLQTTLHPRLELDIVHIDQVDIVHIQAFHTLIHTLYRPFGAVVPEVHTILTVAPHLRREIILVTRNLLQGLAQHRLCLRVSIVGRHVDEVDAIVHSRMHGTDSFFLTDAVKHPSQRRSAKAQVRHPHPCLSHFVIYHCIFIF